MKTIKINKKDAGTHVQYSGFDACLLKSRFNMLRPDTIDRLCSRLTSNNQTIEVVNFYDYQSGWFGTHFKLGKVDLSCNGFCLSNPQVELFLHGGIYPNWFYGENSWMHTNLLRECTKDDYRSWSSTP